ncbi:fimbrial protein [Pseudoxanthomonas sp.]|jgi:type 1 fimbria pilin|uniref:fimbrial protein n=1 Tax=Pseudoxanthomonas sp. TaxID=1871049 RepID=UPI002E1667B6|nr:fimbrial protein [Pseudoxanthomonas sp.]
MIRRALLIAAVVLAWSGQAHAQSATASINLNGRVLAGTCTAQDINFTLPDIRADEVAASQNSIGPIHDVELVLTNCSGVGVVAMTFSGRPHVNDVGLWHNTAPNPAPGVAISLRRKTPDDRIENGTRWAYVVYGSTFRFPMTVSYFRVNNDAPRQGGVAAAITVTLAFQ